ncbi:hypothetical protein [Arthrobacter sp. UNC362MFTsu5.1]|uniref:hypothetical protein n=1 Tax=Arthrobacter sp. UNC362MFTsu5.1 TaxID=1449044 RepID=UPI0012DC856D|nr:hypothetical protein [Arthrobacter sp. UNC362MFTsu5.1]
MHSFTRRGLRSRRFPEVTRQEIATFVALDEEKQFQDLRSLRTRAAHLSGGSLGAFTALYVGVILVAFPLLGQATASWAGPFASPLSIALLVLFTGCSIAYSYVYDQHDMARAATRLAFYEQALKTHPSGTRVPGERQAEGPSDVPL